MALGWVHALVVCASLVGGRQEKAVEARIQVKNTTPERIVATLMPPNRHEIKMPVDPAKLRVDPGGTELIVVAKPSEIEDLREIVRLLDIVPKRVELKVRLVRFHRENGKLVQDVLSDMTTLATNNRPVVVSGSDPDWDLEVKVLPRINGDGSVSLFSSFKLDLDGATKSAFRTITRRIHAGETLTCSYTKSATEKEFPSEDIPDVVLALKASLGRSSYRVDVTIVDVK